MTQFGLVMRLNRTTVECKLKKGSEWYIEEGGLNRTTVECK